MEYRHEIFLRSLTACRLSFGAGIGGLRASRIDRCIERIEEAIMSISGRVTNDMSCPTQPSCWPLLTAPEAVLKDAARQPTHLCRDMLEESTASWTEQH